MGTFYFEHNITQRQSELSSKVVEAVRYQGNCTRENIPQLTKLRDAFKDNNKIGLIDHSPILDIIAFDDGYSDVFNEDNISLLLQVLKTILPGITTIQYSKFGGENKRLFSATPEELAQLAALKEKEEQERKEHEQKAKEQEIEESLIRSRIPQNLWDKYTFKDFNVTDIDNARSNKEAYRLARQFTSINFSDDKISDEEVEQLQADRHNLLTFIGAPGTGNYRKNLLMERN